ncbi:uncharacterized protein TRAVEDRAFT_54505 [Trametes versicolor FP-101664 SS1]|uniref:BED-type domain-containing protein n=1 Tax=Trametes versicolor (strain FP-101664) TaxID=717944 RepID=R7S6F0_TRAVS|nr:uncharacterized protein TRAVEDRAFT_54505 [Trametes versicolor FP-101664 SS1]EIW51466.1 hypothetical protein TRAVEDRAFT_54505 [Trametes versicolor FP-101664 SS1]
MSFEAGNKHRRDTVSSEATRVVLSGSAGEGGLDATPLQPAKARGQPSDVASPPKKKLKDDGSDDDSQAGDVSSPEGDPSDDSKNSAADGSAEKSGAEAATDGGIEALATVTRNASRCLRLLTADEKRVRFQEKYQIISKGWRSKVYGHFKVLELIAGPKGSYIYRFVCKRCPSKHVDRADYEYSTGNLKRHVDSCEPDDTPEGEKISAFAHGITYTPPRMRLFLALWCARHHRPYAIVKDPELQNIFRMLYAKVKIPSCVNG